MLFKLALMLAVVIGARSEYNCKEIPPTCVRDPPVPEEALIAHHKTGNIFPSDQFFVDTCGPLTTAATCMRDYYRECPEPDMPMNIDVLVDDVVEFCDEDSEYRKTYVSNVDCFNTVNFTSHACFNEFRRTMRRISFAYLSTQDESTEIKRSCLEFHVLKPCIVSIAGESCGEDARAAATDYMRRLDAVFECSDEDADFFDGILAELNSRLEENDETNEV